MPDEKNFLSRIENYIACHRMMNMQSVYLVGVSGGADSVCLLLVLKRFGYRVEAVHCNFHLRGAESDRDEHFVDMLCKKESVPLHVVHFDTREYAALHKVSIEMAARELRYGYFERLMTDIFASGICIAHHRDDSVETFLMNVVRGTGIHGLTGIQPVNGNIIRPLLCVSRNEIECYLKSINQDFITDSTNLIADVTRNRIRLNVIPMLEEINPSVSSNIQKTCERLDEIAKIADCAIHGIISRAVQEAGGRTLFSLSSFRKDGAPESALFAFLSPYHFTPMQCEQIYHNLDAPTGRSFISSSHELFFSRGDIVVYPKMVLPKPMRILEPGIYVYGDLCKMQFSISGTPSVSKDADIATLDADKVKFPLVLRPIEEGDSFYPFGMKGSKLLSDYLTDMKCDMFEKRRQLVVCDASGSIIWVVGRRTDNRFRITSDTSSALKIVRK